MRRAASRMPARVGRLRDSSITFIYRGSQNQRTFETSAFSVFSRGGRSLWEQRSVLHSYNTRNLRGVRTPLRASDSPSSKRKAYRVRSYKLPLTVCRQSASRDNASKTTNHRLFSCSNLIGSLLYHIYTFRLSETQIKSATPFLTRQTAFITV